MVLDCNNQVSLTSFRIASSLVSGVVVNLAVLLRYVMLRATLIVAAGA